MQAIAENIAAIRRRIDSAALEAGRDPGDIRLVAVSKTKPAGMVREAFEAGQRLFGESYVQEFLAKLEEPAVAALPIEWHFIGHLQSNKVRQIVGKVALIHGIDKVSTVRELSKQAVKHGVNAAYLLEVNTSGEESKYGLAPDELLSAASELFGLPGVTLRGLMTIASPDPILARAEFRDLRLLLERLRQSAPDPEALSELSMGMSGDFEEAVAEGATMIRVGTAIFGRR